ncbi:macrophage expressed 1 [Cichlidogyrus casuarinus]|uniref:Macrophage expressed 1 n=1 Tax=Cichlidogyrus casuarinus TaxID=1844966 RepID=A0ABD2Q8W0_9PLAT
MDNYMKVVKSRFQTTHGGASISFCNTSFEEWQMSVPHNMVAVDRVGRPIYEAVSASKLPELEPSLIAKIVEVLKSAVHRYYEANIVPGCLDPKSPLFDPNANTPSNAACSVSEASFFKKGQIFGGTFQICQGLEILCKHPLTGKYSCPSSYTPVRLLPRQVIGCVTWVDRGWFWNSYHEFCAETDAFWCSPSVLDGKINGAYFFGGIFSDTSVNPVTGDRLCPDKFDKFRLGEGIHSCASVDYEIAVLKSVPFGGLYACQSGNPMTPLIENFEKPLTKSGNVDSLEQAPKRCPSGYVTHSAGLEDISFEEKIVQVYMQALDDLLLELRIEVVVEKAASLHRDMKMLLQTVFG